MPREEILKEVSNYPEKFFYSVKEIAQRIKELLDEGFTYLWIEGELTNLKFSQTGNLYFTLAEEEATLKGIVFKDQKNNMPLEYLKEGTKVLVYGKLTYFMRSGEIFLSAKKIEPLGLGILHLKREYLLRKYAHLFDPNLKREIPSYPQKIALITSLFGAALEDFLKVSLERWGVHILIYPVKVQGEGAHLEIVQAIRDLNESFPDLDVIIITRGGGSLEDLAPFYTEEIILEVRNSKIPVVSAVGHEIDYTLCDLAADKRCPTPTAAAIQVLPDKKDLEQKLETYSRKLNRLLELLLSHWERRVKDLHIKLQEKNPFREIHHLEQKLKDYKFNLFQKISGFLYRRENKLLNLKKELEMRSPVNIVQREEERLSHLKKLLFSLSPYNILEKGYSIVKRYPQKEIIKSSHEVKIGDHLEIVLGQGKVWATVWKKED